MMSGPMSWASVGLMAAGAGIAYAMFRGWPRRRETLVQKKHRKRRERNTRIARTRAKGLHDLRMIWAIHGRGGDEALKAYIATRKPHKRGKLVWA